LAGAEAFPVHQNVHTSWILPVSCSADDGNTFIGGKAAVA